jgi:hypothetical protein
MATIHFTWLDKHGNRSHDYARPDNRDAKLAYLQANYPEMRNLQEEILPDSGKHPLDGVPVGDALGNAPDESIPTIRQLIRDAGKK